MKIKRIQARNNQEALMKVKMELGPDAVIIHQRKIKPKGILGFFKKPIIEVVAAREDITNTVSSKQNISSVGPGLEMDNQPKLSYQTLENELQSIKSLLNKLANQHAVTENTDQVQIQQSLLNTILRENDMDPNVIEVLVNECQINTAELNDNNLDENKARELIRSCIKKRINIQPYDPHQKVLVFVGPTGVGKTTTIAKLAARATLNEGKKVGLISADTYRIAAVEQLRTYSDILNIPLHVIYQPEEISDAIKQLQHLDLIMVDTAGRSHRDENQIIELKRLLDQINGKEIYLLLSCTTRQQDIRDILDKYSFLEDYKVIITKVDEATAFGTLINVPVMTEKAISFMTTGQSVPDDIEVVTIDKIMNLMIKETV